MFLRFQEVQVETTKNSAQNMYEHLAVMFPENTNTNSVKNMYEHLPVMFPENTNTNTNTNYVQG